MAEAVHQLPRGRHGLSREEVRSSQRERMLAGMVEAVGELGYAGTSVAEVISRARVSRETFYEHFSDKQECFLAAHDRGVDVLLDAMRGGEYEDPDEDPIDRVDGALRRYLTALEANPAIARTFLVEVYAAGPAALRRRMELQDRFVAAFEALVDARDERERFACRMFVAGVSSLVTARVSVGRSDELAALCGPLVALVREALDRRDAQA